jgi:group I intron endonuclease
VSGRYTVYKHTSPSGKVYIGITSQKPENRWGRSGAGYKHSPHFRAAIQKHGWENIRHEILATGLSQQEAERLEVELIAKYQSTDRARGYNADAGGSSPGRQSAESIRKRSEAMRGAGHPFYGKHLSAEHRQKLSDAHKGTHHRTARSAEHRQKLSESNRGKHPSEVTRQKLSAAKKKKVECIETGAVYPSVSEAAEAIGVKASNMSAVCRGKIKTLKGLHFQYAAGKGVVA